MLSGGPSSHPATGSLAQIFLGVHLFGNIYQMVSWFFMPPGTLQTSECSWYWWVSCPFPHPLCVCVCVSVSVWVSTQDFTVSLSISRGSLIFLLCVFHKSGYFQLPLWVFTHSWVWISVVWICERNETSEYIFQKKKTDKTPSISIMSSPRKTMTILGVSMWCWGDESWMRSRWGDAESLAWTENTFSLLWSPFLMPALAAGKKLWPYFGQSFQTVHIKRLASLCLLCRPIPTALLCLAETAHIYLGPTTKREEGTTLNTRKGKLQVLPQKKVTR